MRSQICNKKQPTFFPKGFITILFHTHTHILLLFYTAREEQKKIKHNKLPNLLYREIKLNGENVSYISPCIFFNPLNALFAFAINLERETLMCPHEALCSRQCQSVRFACWFYPSLYLLKKPVSLGHSTCIPVMTLNGVYVCVHYGPSV